jgi:hypothetical protein
MTVGKKEEQEGTAQEQFDEAWDKLDAEDKQGEKAEANPGLSADPDPEDEKPADDATNLPGDSASLKNETEQQAESAEAKALKDTKAWATKLSQENAELKRLIAEGATKKEVAEQEKAVEGAKANISDDTLSTVFREYPELKDVLTPLLDTVKSLQAETETFKKDKQLTAEEAEKKAKQEALEHFENQIIPKVTEGPDGHPDFKEIIGNADFFEWAEKQRPGLQTAALRSNDPEDIKWALTQYKKDRAMPEAANLKRQEEEKRKQKLNNQMSLRGGSSALSTGKAKADPGDYDAAWEQAEREERSK